MDRKIASWFGRAAMAWIAVCVIALKAGCSWSPFFSAGRHAEEPDPACRASLVVGGIEIPAVDLSPGADGKFSPAACAGMAAYHLAGKGEGSAYVLFPATDFYNLLKSVRAGGEALVTFSNCDTASFSLVPARAGQPDLQVLSSLPLGMISIIVLPDNGLDGLTVSGVVRGETLHPANQPPGGSGAEVTLLSAAESRPGQTLESVLSVTGTGAEPFEIKPSDISLVTADGQELSPVGVEPALPARVSPGQALQITLRFDPPADKAGVIKFLGMELDLGG